MADKTTSYDKLPVSAQVRVNAVIFEAFEKQEGFVTAFRAQVVELGKGDRNEGFQQALDRLRNHLASDLKHIPEVTKNGLADQNDLNQQRTSFRDLKEVMGKERPNAEYAEAQIQAMVAKRKSFVFDNDKHDLPTLVTEYKGQDAMLANAAAKEAFKSIPGVSYSEGATATNLPSRAASNNVVAVKR